MKTPPPFISNSPDDMHCVNAVFRMVAKTLLHCDFTWKEIDALSKAIPGKATWTFIAEMEFAKLGLTVINIEPIDYEKLFKESFTYLRTILGEKTVEYYERRSNLASVLKYIPEYLERVHHETRRATSKEIIEYLQTGALVGAEINSSILNNKEGFSLHFVLIYDFDGTHFILHDPGLPPIQSRKVSIKEFEQCFNFPGANGGIILFKK